MEVAADRCYQTCGKLFFVAGATAPRGQGWIIMKISFQPTYLQWHCSSWGSWEFCIAACPSLVQETQVRADGSLIFLSGVPFKLQTSLRYSLFLGKNFDLPETDQQEGVAHACYVPAPVARENFRPREPVQMQQHGLAWFSRSATRHWFDRSRWAISHLMQRGYSFQETAGCWRFCFRFLLQSNLLPNHFWWIVWIVSTFLLVGEMWQLRF